MSDALSAVNLRHTSQRERARADQVLNRAGGHVFKIDTEQRLLRFLMLGTDGGTYYTSERELTRDNAKLVISAASGHSEWVVDLVKRVSLAGRAPRQNATLFTLAAVAGLGDTVSRKAALDALPVVARTGYHLFLFAGYVQAFRGWGRGLRKAVAGWYEHKDVDKLTYQLLKYRQRNGWTHRDLLRLSHPNADTAAKRDLFDLVCGRDASLMNLPLYHAYLEANATTDVKRWADLAASTQLSWEMLPDEALSERVVWEALVDRGLPMTALIRQLPRLSRLGVLKSMSSRTQAIVSRLTDPAELTAARVHPVNLLIAQRTYASGQSVRGSSSWSPVREIVDALDAAFYASFGNVEPAGKRTMLALDVSGSMGFGTIGNLPLTPREASAAISMVTAATEPFTLTVGFTGGSGWGYHGKTSEPLSRLIIGTRQRLDDVLHDVSGLPFGPTDCAQPMLHALKHDLEVDTFVIYTDNETWAGEIHPFQALKRYRQRSGIDARLIVVGMTASEFSIADPKDGGMLDVVGFDSAVPNLISSFSRGDV